MQGSAPTELSKVSIKKIKSAFFIKFEQNPRMEAGVRDICRPPCGDFGIFKKKLVFGFFFTPTIFGDKIHL